MMEISEEAISTILETLAEMREMNKDLTHLRETAEDKALELMEENQELLKENHKLLNEISELKERIEGMTA